VLFRNGGEPVRFGNGVEFRENGWNQLVENCRFWEIYDTAVTNQGKAAGVTQKYIYYRNNMIRNCGLAGFELWLQSPHSEMGYIYFIHNTVVNPGQGWGGETRPDRNSFHIASFGNASAGDNLIIRNNIFYSSAVPDNAGHHLFFYDETTGPISEKYRIDYNLWQMPSPLWVLSSVRGKRSLAEWRTASAMSLNGITGDPLLAAPDSGDFSPLYGSPALDAGVLQEERLLDYFGQPARGAPDLGAVEFENGILEEQGLVNIHIYYSSSLKPPLKHQ